MTADDQSLAPEFTIRDDFPPVSYDQWRTLAEESLQGAPFEKKLVTHTYESIDVQPIYTSRDRPEEPDSEGFPGLAPLVRGSRPLGSVSGWDLRQEFAHPDLKIANGEILDDLAGGVTSLLLRFDGAAREGLDPDDDAAEQAGSDGLTVYHVDDLGEALEGVELALVGVALDAGASFLPAAAILAALWQHRNIPADHAQGAFNADPLAVLATRGTLPVATADALLQMAELAQWTAENYPHVTAVAVSSTPYHHAGATAAQDIAFAAATGVQYLRSMTEAGMEIDTAARQMVFRMGVGTHHFLSIAKLRAARRVWSRVLQACGCESAAAMKIQSRTSDRVLTKRDPYVNLLRNTVGVFSAGIGGADVITSVPFDHMTGLPDEFSRRVARNTALILQEEAHLNRVIDPAGGSWFLDTLTDQLAEKAWEVFQEVERNGGMLKALESGWVGEQIDSAFAPRAKDIARRKEGITGVSEFPDIAEERVTRPPPDTAAMRREASQRIARRRRDQDAEVLAGLSSTGRVSAAVEAAMAGATIGQMAQALGFFVAPLPSIPHLEPRSLAEPFEELRDASDAWLEAHGRRPTAFLANMGPISHHTARATYAKNFFEAGGYEVVTNAGFQDAESAAEALAQSGATVAVICSSDKLYPDVVPQLAPKLKAAGARTVVLAGHPGENEAAWRDAGVDRFIFIKCDVLATLQEMLREEGVLSP